MFVIPNFFVGDPFSKKIILVLTVAYGLNTLFGNFTIVCTLQDFKRFSLIRSLTPVPVKDPSGNTIPALPCFSIILLSNEEINQLFQ